MIDHYAPLPDPTQLPELDTALHTPPTAQTCGPTSDPVLRDPATVTSPEPPSLAWATTSPNSSVIHRAVRLAQYTVSSPLHWPSMAW